MSVVQTVHLKIKDVLSNQVVHGVQNDTDRVVKMVLDDFDLSSGMTATLSFRRPDGTFYSAAATLDTNDNSFSADLTQALTCPGRVTAQLKVVDTNTASTFSFYILVEKDASGVVSEQEGISLTTAVARAEDAADRAESAAEDAEQAAGSLELDTTLSIPGKAADAAAVGDEINNIKDDLDDVGTRTAQKTEISGTAVTGTYINTPLNKFGTASASTFSVKYIPVEAGKKYNITASPIKTLYSEYGLVAFSTDVPENGVSCSELVEGSTEEISIDYNYTASANGYIAVSLLSNVATVLHFYEVENEYALITDKTLLLENVPADAKAVGDALAEIEPGSIEVDDTLTIEGEAADAKAAGDGIRGLEGILDDITETTEEQTEITTISTIAGLYINENPAIYGTASASYFSVKYISVIAGKKYRITANPIKTLFAQYSLVAFSESVPAYQGACTVLVTGSTEEISVDYEYTATKNGYLAVALHSSVSTILKFYEIDDVYHLITDKTLEIEYAPADAEAVGERLDLLGYGTTVKSDVISSEHDVQDRYIVQTGALRSAGSNNYAVAWYPVKSGKTYTISGTASVGGSGQALVCFDNVYNSDVAHVCKTVLQTATTTATEYNISLTPTEDGYVVMPKIDRNGLVVTLVSDTDYQRIYDIEKAVEDIEAEIGKTKMPVKIQLFGDSITDNKWGDRTTWANYITQDLADYNVTVVNDAVGGSGIGHGKSSGTTDSHQTEEYNYVYDLVTDGTTLQTDANYIVILVGTNNWTSGTDLGDMSSTGYATIYGALKGILEYISTNTSATVFVCTIPQRYNSADQSKSTNAYGEPINADNVSLADYCEPFKKLSAFYGMPCIDLNASLGWNRINISNFCGDGLHPNAKGDKMIAALICGEIEKHIGKVSYS